MKNEHLKHLHFDTLRSPLEKPPLKYEVARIAAQVADLTDKAITEAIIEAAKREGITDLYLIDKPFILEAIKEKMKLEKNEPLTLAEVVRCKDCKYYGEFRDIHGKPLDYGGCRNTNNEGTIKLRGERDFCSLGERKDGGAEE